MNASLRSASLFRESTEFTENILNLHHNDTHVYMARYLNLGLQTTQTQLKAAKDSILDVNRARRLVAPPRCNGQALAAGVAPGHHKAIPDQPLEHSSDSACVINQAIPYMFRCFDAEIRKRSMLIVLA